jgi:hypothetical protein
MLATQCSMLLPLLHDLEYRDVAGTRGAGGE